jgi:hypothetical protein
MFQGKVLVDFAAAHDRKSEWVQTLDLVETIIAHYITRSCSSETV